MGEGTEERKGPGLARTCMALSRGTTQNLAGTWGPRGGYLKFAGTLGSRGSSPKPAGPKELSVLLNPGSHRQGNLVQPRADITLGACAICLVGVDRPH